MKRFYPLRMRAFVGIMLAAAFFIVFAAAPAPVSAETTANTQLAALSQALNSLWSLLGSLKMSSSGLSLAQVSSTSCSASLISLLGDGCHQMYTDSSGNAIYCNSAMTLSAKAGDTAVTQGCSSHTGSTGTTSGTGAFVLTAPTNLTATQSGSNIILNWTDNSYEETYTVEKRTAGGSWTVRDTFTAAGGTGYYQDTGGANAAGTYEYRVKACGGGACGVESAVASITVSSSSSTTTTATTTTTTTTTPTTTTPPPPPPTTTTTTSGTSAGLAGSVSGSDIVLNWNDFYTGEDEYQIDRRIGTGAWATISATVFLAGTPGTYRDLAPPSGTYDYRVRPCTRTSGCTGESNYARVTIGGSTTSTTAPTTATPAPVISAIAVTGITANTATVGWITDIPANSRVEYSGGASTGSFSYPAFVTNHTVYMSGLTASTTYTYSVISENIDYYRTTFSNQKFTTLSAPSQTTSSSCDSALVALLGTDCHYMYSDSAGRAIYCDGPMTKSAKAGDTAVTQGCQSSLPTGVAQCADGKDNDNDGLIDYPQDTSCYSRDDNDEWYPSSGQTGTTTPSGIPISPTNANAVQSGVDVGITWDDNATNEDSYKVEWYNGSDWIVMRTVGIVFGGRGGASDYSPSSQRTHQYRVKACNTSGCSAPSNVASVFVSSGNVSTCPAGFHSMSGVGGTGFGTGAGYCMSDADGAVCQALGGGAAYRCPGDHTATSTPGVAPTLASLSPNVGPIGTRVVITGYGFMPAGNRVNFDSGVIMDVSSPDGKTLGFVVPADRVPVCAVTEPRCLLPAPYNPVKPGTYWVSVLTRAGASGGIPFSVMEKEAGVFSVDASASWPRPGVSADTGTRVRVKFTREIDTASLSKEFFRLTKTSAIDARVSGSFSVFPDGFEFLPSGELEPNTGYTYTVFSSVRDRAGNPLSAPYSASFTTAGSTRGSGTIAGSVSDAKGNPLAGVYISVFSPQTPIPYAASGSDVSAAFYNYFSRNTKTDAAGSFQLTVPPGRYMVEAHPPYERTDIFRIAPREVTVAAGETKTVNFTLGSAVKIITGTVLFADGTAVTDAMVGGYASETRQWASAAVDAAGVYTLKVGAGQWLVGIYPKTPGASWTWNGKPQGATFARDGREETITRNFTVVASNAVIVVTATDESGAPVEGAGIIADSHSSASLSAVESSIPPEFRITGADGKTKFVLPAGLYYLRGYVSQQRGLSNPAEYQVRIVGGQTQEATLAFKKKQVAPALTISGATKIEEGIAVDAFVWAWSERGGFTSVRAGKDGLFSFGVGAGERWHVGAGKEYKGFPYKSPEIVVDVKVSSVTVELLLTKQTLVPLPPTVSVSEPGTQQVVAQAADGAKITIPPASAASTGDVKVEIKPTVEAPTQAGTDVVSTVYDVTVHDAAGKEVTTLSKEAEIVIPYSEADLKKQGVSEDAIVPSFFDEKTGVWVKLDGCTIDKERNVAVCRVNHLTRFAITARADSVPPDAPTDVAAKPVGAGQIQVTWKNPAKDFDYAKVYRSVKVGELGTVVAAAVRSAAFVDAQGLADGATYYYTVRAVDPAGNESVNIAQVSVMAKGSSGAAPATKPAVSAAGAALTRTLNLGARGDDVKLLQQILVAEGMLSPDNATGYFGKITRSAVIAFQEKYAAEVLTPAGLTKGSGIVGPGTRKKVNALLK